MHGDWWEIWRPKPSSHLIYQQCHVVNMIQSRWMAEIYQQTSSMINWTVPGGSHSKICLPTKKLSSIHFTIHYRVHALIPADIAYDFLLSLINGWCMIAYDFLLSLINGWWMCMIASNKYGEWNHVFFWHCVLRWSNRWVILVKPFIWCDVIEAERGEELDYWMQVFYRTRTFI